MVALGSALACKPAQDELSSGRLASGSSEAAPGPRSTSSGPPSVPAAPAAAVELPGANLITYVASDFAFDGPPSVPAGLTTFRFQNQGKELHHLVVFKLQGGKSAEDFIKAMHAGGSETRPEWAVPEGGPVGIAPGGESNSTQVLEPGHYALVCFVPSPDGVPHMAKGMMAPLEVVAGSGASTPEPRADLAVKLVDYDFEMAQSLTSGPHVVRVDNAGSEVHELVIWQLPSGKSLSDVLAWVDGGLSGPPPGQPVAGVSPMARGGHAYVTMNLPPGEYALICFVSAKTDGKPHYAHGMARQIAVNGGAAGR
jgi:uncharacterized cupredoxin-like copper-binding protein